MTNSTIPKLTRVTRLDSLPLSRAYFTEEGYLVDKPILTSTGIFEYTNPDGTIRRELRLPEEVFAEKSLKTYRGKPVIVTHDAGLISKDNVHEEAIGTILSDGYRDGDDVRAEIIIHDTNEMKSSGLKELSLGYNLDLDETPGYWNGKPYDAIQRNITINHLALVLEARAGDQARLNIDSRDSKTLKGAKVMAKRFKRTVRGDSVLSPDELAKALADYKHRRAQRMRAKEDADDEGNRKFPNIKAVGNPPGAGDVCKEDDDEIGIDLKKRKAAMVDKRDRRDEEGDPESKNEMMRVIAQQDGDIEELFDIIDTLLAERDMKKTESNDCDDSPQKSSKEEENEDDDDDIDVDFEEENEDDDDDIDVDLEEENEDDDADIDVDFEEENEDDDDDEDDENFDDEDDVIPNTSKQEVKMDSVDKLVRQRVKLGMIGRLLNMDGLEDMKNLTKAKKKVIRKARPGMRLDGKSKAYIDAAFDYAVSELKAKMRKGTAYQRKQMSHMDSKRARKAFAESSQGARQRMIARQMKKGGK